MNQLPEGFEDAVRQVSAPIRAQLSSTPYAEPVPTFEIRDLMLRWAALERWASERGGLPPDDAKAYQRFEAALLKVQARGAVGERGEGFDSLFSQVIGKDFTPWKADLAAAEARARAAGFGASGPRAAAAARGLLARIPPALGVAVALGGGLAVVATIAHARSRKDRRA